MTTKLRKGRPGQTFTKFVQQAVATSANGKPVGVLISATHAKEGSVDEICDAVAEALVDHRPFVSFRALYVFHKCIRNGDTDAVCRRVKRGLVMRLRSLKESVEHPDEARYASYLELRMRAYRALSYDVIQKTSEYNKGDGASFPPLTLNDIPVVQRLTERVLNCNFEETGQDVSSAINTLVKDLILLLQAQDEAVYKIIDDAFDMPRIEADRVLKVYDELASQMGYSEQYFSRYRSVLEMVLPPASARTPLAINMVAALREYIHTAERVDDISPSVPSYGYLDVEAVRDSLPRRPPRATPPRAPRPPPLQLPLPASRRRSPRRPRSPSPPPAYSAWEPQPTPPIPPPKDEPPPQLTPPPTTTLLNETSNEWGDFLAQFEDGDQTTRSSVSNVHTSDGVTPIDRGINPDVRGEAGPSTAFRASEPKSPQTAKVEKLDQSRNPFTSFSTLPQPHAPAPSETSKNPFRNPGKIRSASEGSWFATTASGSGSGLGFATAAPALYGSPDSPMSPTPLTTPTAPFWNGGQPSIASPSLAGPSSAFGSGQFDAYSPYGTGIGFSTWFQNGAEQSYATSQPSRKAPFPIPPAVAPLLWSVPLPSSKPKLPDCPPPIRFQSRSPAPIPRTFGCKICFETHPIDNIAKFHGCDHSFCRECAKAYLETSVDEGKFPIVCPVCMIDTQKSEDDRGGVTTEIMELSGVSEDVFRRYIELELAQLSVKVRCPKCRKTALVDRYDLEQVTEVVCPLRRCRHVWCKRCNGTIQRNSPHSCGTNELERLMARRGWKRCPGCETPVERIEGCNHMTCSATGCNTHFCYIDGALICRTTNRTEVAAAVEAHYHNCRLIDDPRRW